MSENLQKIEPITSKRRRRYWSKEEKLRIVQESLEPGATVSVVARRNGVTRNLLYRWRRLLSDGQLEPRTHAKGNGVSGLGFGNEVRHLEVQVRELERLLGRKTMENELLRENLARSEKRVSIAHAVSLAKD